MPEKKCIFGQKGKRECFSAPGFLLWGFYWAVCCAQQRPSFLLRGEIPATTMSAHGWCMEADSLWPVCRQTNRNSYSSTEVNILLRRNTACTPHMWTYTHILPFLHHFWGVCITFSYCTLDVLTELLEKRWIMRSGCSNSALHPLLLCFYLTSLLITRHRLLALQESCAMLSYFIVR